MSSVWRSVLVFVLLVFILGVLGVVFFPAH